MVRDKVVNDVPLYRRAGAEVAFEMPERIVRPSASYRPADALGPPGVDPGSTPRPLLSNEQLDPKRVAWSVNDGDEVHPSVAVQVLHANGAVVLAFPQGK